MEVSICSTVISQNSSTSPSAQIGGSLAGISTSKVASTLLERPLRADSSGSHKALIVVGSCIGSSQPSS
ncbi:hypothetical protein AB1Y20_004297 [Prymnesium parvum]|uniref:Uncharacterized protein n=1 Tax=Prymnesium parvum TaxID=97485 RepID=A0AB34IVX9_PRYPA